MHEWLDLGRSWIAVYGRPGLIGVVLIWAYCSRLVYLADEEGKRIREHFFSPMILLMTLVWTAVWGFVVPEAAIFLLGRSYGILRPMTSKTLWVVGFWVYFFWWVWTMSYTITPFRRILRKQRR